MSEQTMRKRVVQALRKLDAVSVENRVHPGTPDVNYVEGWLELKWLRRWPRNANESPVLIPHFTPQQRIWLRRRYLRGGRAYLLLQVGQEWMLFDGETAAKMVGRETRLVLEQRALRHWRLGLNFEELRQCISGI